MDDKKKAKTLLFEFIEEKYKKYSEPTREGTPRGETIGFSRKKYFATLLMMYNLKLKDIAKEAEVSYGLIRKWTTEKAFKDMVFDHYTEFTTWIVGYIFKRTAVGYEATEDIKKKALNELANINPCKFLTQKHFETDTALEKLSDAGNYNKRLLFIIMAYLREYLEKDLPKIADRELAILFTSELYGVVSIMGKNRTPKERIKETIKLEYVLCNSMLDDVVNILSKPKMTSNDKKEVIMTINTLKQMFNTLQGIAVIK